MPHAKLAIKQEKAREPPEEFLHRVEVGKEPRRIAMRSANRRARNTTPASGHTKAPEQKRAPGPLHFSFVLN
jgi:hypothetical protein